MMSGPTTPTGQRLTQREPGRVPRLAGTTVDDILAIEQEAAAAALPKGAAVVTVESLADLIERDVWPDDYYRYEPDTPFGPEETWFDAGAFAAAIIAAIKEAERVGWVEDPEGFTCSECGRTITS